MSPTLPNPGAVPQPVNYDAPSELSALLEGLGLGMRKKYGQNFLISGQARRRIAALFATAPGARVWEIGPGTGSMTREALVAGLAVSAFEIDKGFAEFIRGAYGQMPGFELYEGDFMKTWKTALAASGVPSLAFGNLPYNAAGAIIATLIEGGVRPTRMVFTVQKEAAQRMCSQPSTKNYSAFSVLCQSTYLVKSVFDLSPGSFWPQPRVSSAVVTMEARTTAIPFSGEKSFTGFTRACFSSRRKTLRNNLKAAGFTEAALMEACSAAGISPDARAETLSPERFSSLYIAIKKPEFAWPAQILDALDVDESFDSSDQTET
ncbi:MAG: ribosomal RNA small subunit methyltransferase A [Spirochaetes bacterium GWB1_59_5]|nr:MAG: ribosomal RNA small subunit methyltransferase A [Spirochaetes bacterium GWB1_59_5]